MLRMIAQCSFFMYSHFEKTLFFGDDRFCRAVRLRSVLPITRVHNFGTYFVTANCAERRRVFQVERAAELFFDVLQGYREHYRLHAFVIMPDHVHLLLTPGDVALERCLQLIKGGFSFRYHKELEGRKGVWQKSSADHRCRDAADFLVRKKYIEDNPVVAGLVGVAEEFKWSSASRFLRQGLGGTPSAAKAASETV